MEFPALSPIFSTSHEEESVRLLMNPGTLLLTALGVACAGASQRSPEAPTVAGITTADLEHRLRIIADDSMMGRESGSEGDYKTAEYISSEFRRLGLEPAGDSGTYFQTVPFWTTAADPSSRLDVGGTGLQLGRDFLPGSPVARSRDLTNAEVVYGGSLGDPAAMIGPDQAADKV